MRRIPAEGNGDGLVPVLLCLGRCSRSAAGGSGDFLTTVVLNLGHPQSRVSYLSLVHVLC